MEEVLIRLERTVTQSQTMTTKEIANALGVDPSTVVKACKRLSETSAVLPKFTQGQTPRYTQEQATLIKQEIQKHHNLQSRQIDSVSTEVEENQTIANALMILQRRSEEYRIRAERAERTNAILMHTSKLYTVTEIAKELGYRSAVELNKELEVRGLQYRVNGTWVPTAKYSNLGLFEIKQEVHDDTGYVYYDRKVTQEGRKYILELLS